MSQLLTGNIFNPNDSVTSTKLNGMVNNAALLAGAISEQIAITESVATADKLLIYDASNDALRNVTVGNLLGSPGPIGSTTPNSGSFTSLNASNLNASNVTAGAASLTSANIATLSLAGIAFDLVGMVAAFPLIAVSGNYTAPSGWLLCNGASVSRMTYSALFDRIGTIFGYLGANVFNLPDLRGYFIRGVDAGRGIDASRVMGSSQADTFQSHTHDIPVSVSSSNDFDTTGGSGSGRNGTTSQTGAPSVGSGTETRPKNVALYYCIKY